MDEKMSLEQVRDWHAEGYRACLDNGYIEAAIKHRDMADAIDVHLAQPSQAVDVGEAYVQAMVKVHEEKSRAIGNAQAEWWKVPEDMALIPRHYASNIQVAACMMEQSGSVLDRREAPILRKVAAMLASPTTHPGHPQCP